MSRPLPSVPPIWRGIHDPTAPYCTGNSIASHCRYVWNYDGFKINESVDNDWTFAKFEFLQPLIAKMDEIGADFSTLITHNSDFPTSCVANYITYPSIPEDLPDPNRVAEWIAERHAKQATLRSPIDHHTLKHWFAVNTNTSHPKIHPIPIGVCGPLNQGASNVNTLNDAITKPIHKDRMFIAAYKTDNHAMRTTCLRETRIPTIEALPIDEYMDLMRRSCFCISPQGQGIDSYRTWEAITLGTIPIVTKEMAPLACEYPEVPMVVLDSWADFKKVNFTESLYHEAWGDFDPTTIVHTTGLLKRIHDKYGIAP